MNKITGNKYFTSSCEAGVGEIILRLSAWAYKRFSRFRWPNISNFLLTLPKNFHWKVQDLWLPQKISTGKWRIGQVLENNVKKNNPTNTQDRIGGKGRRGISWHFWCPIYFISSVGTNKELKLKKANLFFKHWNKKYKKCWWAIFFYFLRGWGGGRHVFNSFSTILALQESRKF